MILVREVFKLKIGKAKDAKALYKEASALAKKYDMPVGRAYTDLVGPYYTFVWGRVRFIVLDCRTFKSNPADTDNSSKTALGTVQKQWFKDTLAASTEPLIFVLSESPWKSVAEAGDDAWAGYTTERAELAAVLSPINSGSRKVIMLCGDGHMIAADNGSGAPGGCPTFAGSPFYAAASIKGGSYSAGTYPTVAGAKNPHGRICVTPARNSPIPRASSAPPR